MKTALIVAKGALKRLLSARKISLNSARDLYEEVSGGLQMSFDQLHSLATLLNVSLSHVIQQLDSADGDLKDHVKICSGQIRFDRLKRVEGEPAYFYRHVMKTSADKNLMVLRTSPLFTSPDKAPVNKGHQAKEFVYVLSGAVGVLWCNKVGERREDVLAVGDSIFIDAWVPHAFYALESGSQILAVDYT